jgi:Ni,Fe-hydrogenase I cytochrome b subunit
MINYLVSGQNTLVWFCFTAYVFTAIFLVPNISELNTDNIDISNQKALKFASKFIFRLALIFPMLFLLKNAI